MATTSKNQINTITKDLSIQINLNGLSFCILNTESNSIEYLEQILFPGLKNTETVLDAVKHIFNTNTQLHQNFKNVTLIHQNIWQTLVPKALFNETLLTDYLKYNTKILKTDFIAYDELISNIVSVYIPYTNINNYVFDHFGSFTYKHQSTILIESLERENKHNPKTKAYINFNTSSIDLIVFKAGKLELYNSFETFTQEDVIYYILFTFEQLQINPETIDVSVIGLITEDDANYRILYKYIRNVEIYKSNYSFTFKSKPIYLQHYYSILNSI
ncbi:DUF3822 family protein [Aurantibacter sp.]|uniref:DUF3822 family protein n=1 Tax=Aurantibacter sp. TaxID=2807103 RepID=UPI0035C8130A